HVAVLEPVVREFCSSKGQHLVAYLVAGIRAAIAGSLLKVVQEFPGAASEIKNAVIRQYANLDQIAKPFPMACLVAVLRGRRSVAEFKSPARVMGFEAANKLRVVV